MVTKMIVLLSQKKFKPLLGSPPSVLCVKVKQGRAYLVIFKGEPINNYTY